MRLEESHFFLLRPPQSERRLCKLSKDRVVVREEINCPLDPGHQRVGRFFSDLSVVVACSPPADFLFTWAGECLVQDRVVEIMQREQLTGFWTGPAKAIEKKTGRAVAVRRLGVKGWGGVVSPGSGIRQVAFCPACLSSHWSDLTNPAGLINPENWDGSDFFIIWPLPAYYFVSERVVEVVKKYGLRGAEFVKSFPTEGTGLGYSPQRLSHSMPEDRAHEIGDPLGIY